VLKHQENKRQDFLILNFRARVSYSYSNVIPTVSSL